MKRGDRLPALERAIELSDMVAYAGATWDWHRMHYDPDYAASAGFEAPVVDGQMLGALMARQITDALGPRASVTHLAFRFKGTVFAGDTVRVEAEITAAGEDGVVEIAQRVTAGDRLAVEGSARARVR